MKKMSFMLASILSIAVFAVAACGGSAPASAEAPAAVTEAPAAVTEAPAAVVEAPAATEAPVAEAKPVEKTPPMLHIALVKGQVEIRESTGGEFIPATMGQKIGVGAEIRTGADGIVALYRDTLSMVVLDQKSVMVVKKLGFTAGQPITILALINGAAAVEHNGKLPEGAILAIETPNKQLSGVVGSTVRVSFDTTATPPVMTATCISGECNFVKGDQTLSLTEGQQVDVTGMVPLPGMPNVMEISTEQANGFLAQAHQMCGCDLPISEIRDTGLTTLTPPSDDVPTPEQDLKNSADENGNTDSSTDEVTEEKLKQITEETTNEVMNKETQNNGEAPATQEPGTSDSSGGS
jgi:hypothetical protein